MALTAINAREAVRAHTLASGTLGKISVGIGDTRRKAVCNILTDCCLTSYTAKGMRLLDSKETEKSTVCVCMCLCGEGVWGCVWVCVGGNV